MTRAFRSGADSTLDVAAWAATYRLGIHDKVIQKILRHSNVSTTTTYYIKSTASDVTEAMQQVEQNIAEKLEGQNLRDNDRTPNSSSGATPAFVN